MHLQEPAKLRGRAIYFVKNLPMALPAEEYEQHLLIGDINADSMEHMCSVAQEIYMPLLSNPRNQFSWSELVAKDVLEHMHSFLADTQISIGRKDGEIVLPLPSAEDLAEKPYTTSKDRIHVLEGCLITWTKQIKSILKRAEEELKKGNLALDEFRFCRSI